MFDLLTGMAEVEGRVSRVARAKVMPIAEALRSRKVRETRRGLEFADRTPVVAEMQTEIPVDFHGLLKQAAKSYSISPDPEDYLVVPVPIVITDIPNSNGSAFSAEDLASFDPEMGMPRYKTWVGKPTFVEHDNQDVSKAKGIILDTAMNPVKGHPGYWKVMNLLAFDRTKDRALYESIESGASNAYSMGAYYGRRKCSICGSEWVAREKPTCSHAATGEGEVTFYKLGRQLAYEYSLGVTGFETSVVKDPAYRMAVSDYVTSVSEMVAR